MNTWTQRNFRNRRNTDFLASALGAVNRSHFFFADGWFSYSRSFFNFRFCHCYGGLSMCCVSLRMCYRFFLGLASSLTIVSSFAFGVLFLLCAQLSVCILLYFLLSVGLFYSSSTLSAGLCSPVCVFFWFHFEFLFLFRLYLLLPLALHHLMMCLRLRFFFMCR